MPSFAGLNAQVLGISVDHIPCLQAWAESLGGISFPLLSDFWPHGAIAEGYGVFRGGEGKTERAIFVVDGQGIIRYIDIHDIDLQPDNEEIRRILREIEGEAQQMPVFKPFSEADVPAAAVPGEAPADENTAGTRPDGIVLYCARWCKDCKKARAWLEEHQLDYQEVDIDYDLDGRSRLRQWGNGHLITPAFDFDGEIILDFDIEKLEAAWSRRSASRDGS